MNEQSASKVTMKERVAYFLGDFGVMGLTNNFVNTYILFFFTNVLGLSASAGGVLLLVVAVADACCNPVYGWVVDRTRTRFGTYRPYIVGMALPLAVLMVLCFVAPGFTGGGRLAYAYIIYLLYCAAGSIYNCAYGSVSSLMTTDPHEHVVLGSCRELATNSAGFLLNLTATTLLLRFSGNIGIITAGGVRTMAFLVAIFICVCLPVCGIGCKERIPVNAEPVELGKSLGSVAHNLPAVILAVLVLCMNGMLVFKATMTTYYCQYYLGSLNYMTAIMTCMFISPLVCLWFVPKLVSGLGSKKVFMLSGALSVAVGAVILIGQKNLVANCIASLICGVICAVAFSTIWGAVPDCADYGRRKTGVYCPAMIIAATSFATKISVALAQFGVSKVLSLTGYNAELAEQSAGTVHAIYLATGIVPLALGVIAVLAALRYRTDD